MTSLYWIPSLSMKTGTYLNTWTDKRCCNFTLSNEERITTYRNGSFIHNGIANIVLIVDFSGTRMVFWHFENSKL
jgi:hypothetical protein